ncbi:MAG TPA: sulfotransferase [Streptosporangiaceae bacterium]|nr:sulfotransferase [Streptosporangiaceae bacterium]
MEGPAKEVAVLCITGWCRNGSTIIGNVLNEVPGIMHVGELHFLWKNAAGKGANSKCGCGELLTECPFWSARIRELMPGTSLSTYAAEVVRRQRACVRTRHTWRILRRGPDQAGRKTHADLMSRTYQAVAAASGARVIVDTSKIPGEAALLPHLDGITPYFVHLVRDPRAVAESWREPKQYVYAMSAAKSTAYWRGFNLAARAITRRYPKRSLTVRYEDFLADPRALITRLLALCGEPEAANPVRGRVIDLGINHTVTGNPDRFHQGPTELRDTDSRWVTGLPARARLAATVLAWPQFRRYGYRCRAPEAKRSRKEQIVGHRA